MVRPAIIAAFVMHFPFAPTSTRAQPADAVQGVLTLLSEHPIVALDDGDHGNVDAHEFRLRLIRDARFSDVVNDIVIEFGNARYQGVADRYVSGEDIPIRELRHIWQDTSQASAVWDSSIYEDFFRAVRDVNRALPASRRVRVLLGDPPIDWRDVHGFADLASQMRVVGDRDTFPATLIRHEVVDKRRHALIVYGGVHLQRTPPSLKRPCDPLASVPCFPGSIVDQLNAAGVPVFSVHTLTAAAPDVANRLAAGDAPRLIDLRADALGEQAYRAFQPSIPMLGPGGQPQPEAPIRGAAIREVFDALLYIGAPASMRYASITEDTCADAEYVTMRKARMAMVAPPGAAAPRVCGR